MPFRNDVVSRRRERDAVEIAGDYQARAMTSPYAAQRFWHAAKLRIIDRVAPARPGSRVADVGCGSGLITAKLAERAAFVSGFDSNPAAVSFASATYRFPRLQYVLGGFERMLEFAPFDQIYCLEVLEHLYAEQALETLRLFARAARPGTELFVTTPNQRSLWPAIEWALDRLALVPQLKEAQHLTAFTRRSLASACQAAGWDVLEIGTFNGVAPFVAPASERVALAIERAEFAARRVLPLNLLYCHARITRSSLPS
jgi:2-polyprenyl-3-methyl-5-hydroxy-6-metoxy-1,4-benzoquinol methylase